MTAGARRNLPKEQLQVFLSIAGLKDEELDGLYSALGSTAPTLFASDFSEAIAGKVTADSANISDIVSTLTWLFLARSETEVEIAEIVDDVVTSTKESHDLALPGNLDWEEYHRLLRERLERLLSFENTLGIVSKAARIRLQQDRVFRDAQIVTDIRPLFATNPREGIRAAFILHQLRIEYFEGDERKDFYVSLDSSDIEVVRKVLSRALEKAQVLRSLLDAASVDLLGEDKNA